MIIYTPHSFSNPAKTPIISCLQFSVLLFYLFFNSSVQLVLSIFACACGPPLVHKETTSVHIPKERWPTLLPLGTKTAHSIFSTRDGA